MAARGVNKVIILGNLGADPEVRYMPDGRAVANLRIATSEQWKDKNTGEQQERTEWHRVSFFGKPAEIISQYATKGSKLYIEGSLSTNEYEKNGEKRYSTTIRGSAFQFVGGGDGERKGSPAQPRQKEEPSYSGGVSNGSYEPSYDQGFDDDIPF